MVVDTDPPTERPANLRASIDAIQVDILSLRREIDFRAEALHSSNKTAIDVVENLRSDHQKAHERDHAHGSELFEAFQEVVRRIEREQTTAIEKALESVHIQNLLHATAHEREHVASQTAMDKAEATQQRSADKSEAALVARMDQTNQWREQFNRQWTEQQAAFAAIAGTLATRQMVDDKLELATNDREALRGIIARSATRELVDERQATTDKSLQEIRDWKLESQAQLRTWGVMIAVLVVIVNVALRFL